ncbi:GtrA family protein [Halothermothrix orenii]|uniref:GtrA family protein n=1 Tax=Halothermothrix orenii (strain H 168 / OCM 544 / DSM 9562) TaxID=373903 RepID=B8CZB0_HALOH|nr:GtrA family protein [Halothermothrix orenii]ACL70629.1 GtrA family protein [Halothermothrix orenii H 168]
MKKIIELFIKFSLVGLSGVVVNMAVYSSLLYFDVYYLVAAVISFIVAVTNNFYWNFIWTFKGRAAHKTVARKYIDFFVISLINFGVNLISLRILVEAFSLHKVLAQLVAIGIASLLNFLGNLLITFKDKK